MFHLINFDKCERSITTTTIQFQSTATPQMFFHTFAVNSSLDHWSQAMNHQISVSIVMSHILLYKQNHTTCSFLCLTSFTCYLFFNSIMLLFYQLSVSFYFWVVFHGMATPYFIYLLVHLIIIRIILVDSFDEELL